MATDKGLEEISEGMFHRLEPFNCLCGSSAVADIAIISEAVLHIFYGKHERLGNITDARDTGQIESNYDETTDSFDAMDLKSELLRGQSSASAHVRSPVVGLLTPSRSLRLWV